MVTRTALLVVGAALLVALVSGGGAEAAAPARKAYVNGDSLGVGTAPYLRTALRRWRLAQSYDVSRHLDGRTVAAIRARRARLAPVLIISLGTNDDPRGGAQFARGVRAIMDIAGRRRCVVWPNIVRPAHRGVGFEGFNATLARAAARRSNLRIVDWVGIARRNPGWIGRDGVHPNAAGYRARAQAIARAAERCRRSLAR